MVYPSKYKNYNGPSSYPIPMDNLETNDVTFLDTILRSLNISKSFKTSVDSVDYFQAEQVPTTIPGVADAALFPTESGFDLTFGRWYPYNSTIYGKRDSPIEDKKWQYDIETQRWTDTGIGLKNWFETSTSRSLSSSMTAWIPSLKKGFLFGGTFFSVNETSLHITALEEHNGLITYDQATNTWTNESTPFGGISEGGLVHIATARDEILIQFGGRSESATHLVCYSTYCISTGKRLIVFGRENFPRSTSTAQTDRGGILNIYHLKFPCRILGSHSVLLSNRLRMVAAIKST